MRPTTVHHVLSLTDCLAAGGHFYFTPLFPLTLNGYILDHYCGNLVTNTEHIQSGLELFKMVCVYIDAVDTGLFDSPGGSTRIFFSTTPSLTPFMLSDARTPHILSLTSLLLLVLHMDQLHPRLPERSETDWESTVAFKHDFAWATNMTRVLLHNMSTKHVFGGLNNLSHYARLLEDSSTTLAKKLSKNSSRKPIIFDRLSKELDSVRRGTAPDGWTDEADPVSSHP